MAHTIDQVAKGCANLFKPDGHLTIDARTINKADYLSLVEHYRRDFEAEGQKLLVTRDGNIINFQSVSKKEYLQAAKINDKIYEAVQYGAESTRIHAYDGKYFSGIQFITEDMIPDGYHTRRIEGKDGIVFIYLHKTKVEQSTAVEEPSEGFDWKIAELFRNRESDKATD